jgi:ABC-type uncharacterized transport system involved in gliding motility auxiliary subunit
MATNSSEGKPKKAQRIHRFAIGLNVLVQILTVMFILAGINYIAFKHFKRWDFSRDQKYALSDQTKELLKGLQKTLKVYVFFSPDPRLPGGEVFGDIQNLLKEYQYGSNGKLEVETIDPYKNLSRAQALMAQYKFGNENVVVVDYQGHSKLVNAADMAEYDNSGEMYGQPPKLTGFKGEQALTSAILEVTEEKQNKIYLIGGKGGPELAGDDLASFKAYMERQNLKLDQLTLMNVEKIPDDAKVLMLIGAKYDLTDRELALLKDYWEKQGRILVALDPNGHTPKLAGFLKEAAGIAPQDDRVLRTMALGPMTGIVRDVAGLFSDSSAITKRLKGVDTMFMGQTQSLAITQPPGVHTESLVTAGDGYWGETKYQDMESTGVSYDPKEDISAPLTLAASAEKGGMADTPVSVDTSRLVVIGNSTFVTNEALTEANVDFVLADLNWLLNREELIGIAPKAEEQFTLNLNDEQLSRIELLVMVVMPAAVAMLGGVMWAQRRR